jgi:hypothetical protein
VRSPPRKRLRRVPSGDGEAAKQKARTGSPLTRESCQFVRSEQSVFDWFAQSNVNDGGCSLLPFDRHLSELSRKIYIVSM